MSLSHIKSNVLGVLALLFLAQCQTGNVNTVQYGTVSVEPRFGTTIQTRQNLVFRFSKALVRPEEIGTWDTTQFLHIQPRVVGQFKWSAVDELVFSPDKGFAFATGYSAHPSAALSKRAGEELKGEGIRFETEQLNITGCEAHWIKNDQGQAMLLLSTGLNQSILPDELLPALRVEVNGKDLPVEMHSHFPTSAPMLKVPASAFVSNTGDLHLDLHIVAGKLPAQLKKWLTRDDHFEADIPSAHRLQVYGAEVLYEGGAAKLLVRMSQSLQEVRGGTVENQNLPLGVSVSGVSDIKAAGHHQGMEITGSFPGQGVLELFLAKGLTGVLGATLKDDKTLGFRIGNEQPTIRFTSKRALYLPRFGTRHIGFEQEGIKQVQLSVYQVFPNNMLSTISSHGSYYSDENDYEYNNDYYSEYQTDYGTLIYSRSHRINELRREGNQYLLPLDFNALPGQKGIFMVTISDEEEHYIGAKKMVCITDVGLMAKSSADEIWVRAQSIESGKAIDRLKVTVIGKNNQPLHTAETNTAGEVSLARNKLAALGTEPLMLVAENQDDFSYLHFGQTRLETSRFPVDGLPWSASGWQAQVFGPRNLYKPGEPIDLRILLRDKNLAAVAQTPLLVKVMSPEGKVVQMLRVQTGLFGEAGLQFTIPSYLKTGTYQTEVYGGAKELLATHALHIESFKPLPLVIQTGSVPKSLTMGSDWTLNIEAETMFGAPAADRPVEVALSWEPASFQPEGYSDYSFYLQHGDQNTLLTEHTTTNGKGLASVTFPLSGIASFQGLLDLKARVQVSDESNTPVYKTATTQLLTQPGMLGYKVKGNRLYYRRTNRFDLVCLNTEGKPVPGAAHIEVFSSKWSTVMEKAPEEPTGYRYVSRETKTRVATEMVRLPAGKATWNFVPMLAGNYEVVIKASLNSPYALRFDSYVYESENEAPPGDETDTEGNIEIHPLTADPAPGTNAMVRFTTPFDGHMVVTLEQNRILKTFTHEVRGKVAVLPIAVTGEMAPNAYISATLTRPIGKSPHQNPLTVAYGYASLPVKQADKQLKTTLDVSPTSLSGVKLPITIALNQADGESGLALAVVDEGILNITHYRIPDPFVFFHSKKALGVETFAMYGKIFQALGGSKSTFGGDAMYLKMAQNEVDKEEVSVLMTSNTRPESKTHGKHPETGSWLRMESGGTRPVYKAMVQLPPGFAGKVRVMAVTYTQGKVGFAEKVVTVADPITIKTSVPDYLYPGDRFQGSATFFNTGKTALSFRPVLKGPAIAGVVAGWPTQLSLAPGQIARLPFSLTAKAEGTASLSIEAQAPNQTYRLARNFEIKPPAWLVRHQVAGELTPGQSATLTCPLFLHPTKLSAEVEVSTNPFLSIAPALNQLLRYPYGCLEQTVSAAFPLVFMPDEWLNNLPGLPKTEAGQKWKKAAYVTDAIQKVAGLQTYNGGFAYWPSQDDPAEYYSVYATHFLWEARQAGFAVDPVVLQRAQKFLEENLANRSEMQRHSGYDKTGKKAVVQTLDPAIPYSLYTLALMGKVQKAALLQWKAQPEKLDQEGRYMMACALLLAGDPDGFAQMVPRQWNQTAESDPGANPAFYKTAGQEEAFVLSALTSAWPTHPMVKALATRLRNRIALQADNMSTQEEGMALVALARLMKQNAGKEQKATVSQGGKAILQKTGRLSVREWATPLMVQNPNKTTPLYYWLTAQGQSAGGSVPETDQGLVVRKTCCNAMGKPLDPAQLKLNDLVVVRLSLVSATGKAIPQVALVDVVPACFRIENGRLGQESGFITPTPPATPEYLDIRRDRIHFFGTAGAKETSYYYTARVVGMGQFQWGPAEAQAMYQSGWYSRHGARAVTVTARQAEGVAKR